MHPVELHGSKVRLREFQPGDVDAVLALIGDDRVTEWLSFDSRNREQAEAMISGTMERAKAEPRTEYYLAVIDPDDQLVGFARLGFNGVEAAKLGYAVAADHWGKGYATDAARTIIGFGFSELKRHRISAAIGPDNTPSIAVARNLGMTYEGRIRHHVFTNGAWRDSELYSLLDHEWTPPNQQERVEP